MTLSLDSFALKIIKKSEELAFSNKAKIVNINIPEKVKAFIDEHLAKEVKHFQKKYKLEFNLIADKSLILPEYKINLLNKNKKTIKKVENVETFEKILIKTDNKKKMFKNNKHRKNFISKGKFKKKYHFYSKNKKNNLQSKKLLT